MSAETLRAAARLMRDRARGAFQEHGRDLWTDMATIDPENDGWIVCEQRQSEVDWDTTVARTPYDYDGALARHIASWHPAVALSVADWLDGVADGMTARNLKHTSSALTVARTYLGETA